MPRVTILHLPKQDTTMEVTDKLRKVLLRLEEIAKCQVCLESLSTDVAQCSAGHALCIPCRNKLNICPSCKQRFLNIKPTMLVQILEVLPRLCQYAEQGCKTISFTRNHERFCEFRSFKCTIGSPNQRCSWDGAVRNYKAHVQSRHNSHLASYMVGSMKKLLHKNFQSSWLQQEYLHLVDDNLFVVTCMKDRTRQTFVQSVRHVPLGQPGYAYFFIITISKKEMIYKHTIKAIEYDEYERIDLSPHCMVVPLEDITSLLNNCGSLEVSFEVIKKKNSEFVKATP